MRVIEVICRIPEGVNFEFCKEVLGNFLKEPVEDHPAFDTALTMQDEDYFRELRVVESLLYDGVTIANILGCVVKVSLDQALEDIEEDAVPFKESIRGRVGEEGQERGDLRLIVYAKDRAPECEGEAIDIAL